MSFIYGAIIWGSVAAAAPVVIHLLMRSKPRKVTLPTLRFVKTTHRAIYSKLKLKHLILLAMRMAAIILVVLLLARAFLPGHHRLGGGASVPLAMVVVVDNSASMGYRQDGRTLLDRGKQVAAEIVESLPAGSRVAVITSDGAEGGAGFLNDMKLAGQHVTDAAAGFGDTPIAPALERALQMLRAAELPRREVLIISDMTQQAWRDFSPVAPQKSSNKSEGEGVWFGVIDCGAGRFANASLGRVKLSSPAAPLGVEVTLETTLRNVNFGGEMSLQVELDGKPVDRRSVVMNAGEVRSLRIALRPPREGVLHGRVILRNTDALAADNERYFTLRVGSPVEVLFVTTPAGADDRTSFLMANAITPPLRGVGARPSRRKIPPEQLNAENLTASPLVVLTGASALREMQWKLLEKHVRQGGSLWVVAGSMVSVDSYNSASAQRLIPLKLSGQEELPAPMGWKSPDLTRPMFRPFADSGANVPLLSDVSCIRRFGVESTASDAEVALRYTDGVPAIATRSVGAGSIVFWNFSPTRSWSNLGRLGGQLVVLAQRTTELLLGGEQRQTQFAWGQTAELSIPAAFRKPSITLRRPNDESDLAMESTMYNLRRRLMMIPADQLGGYTLTFTETDRTSAEGFSVNVPIAESDLQTLKPKEIAANFPPSDMAVISSATDWTGATALTSPPLDILPPLLLLLLVLLTGESYFANRFYKKGVEEPPLPS